MADEGDANREIDYLDTADEGSAPSGGRRRGGLVVGLTVAGLAIAGGAAYGIVQFLGGGASPAAAVPDDVFAYLAVDLDPGAGQQVEAYRTMKKFPGLEDELKLSGEGDLRKAIFEKIAAESDCDLDYQADIDSWLGDSAAVTGWDYKSSPEVAVAVAVKDQSAAEKGFRKLEACGGESSSSGDLADASNPGVAFTDGWMVLADDHDTAQAFVDAAASRSLADSDDFRSRVDDVGGEGFITGYVASGAVDEMLDGMAAQDDAMAGMAPLGEERAQLEKYFGDFKGAAMSVRFEDGALEVRVKGEGLDGAGSTSGGDSGVEDLPASTAAAFALPVGDSFVSDVVDQMRNAFGAEAFDRGVTELEGQTGLQVPDDLQTLLGDGVTLSVDSSIDPSAVDGSSPQGLEGLPVGLRIHGDPADVRPVLDKVLSLVPVPPGFLHVEDGDDAVALAPDADYASTLAGSGSLGDDDGFTKAVPEYESGDAVFYMDFNGSWLPDLVKADGGPDAAKVLANIEPLDTVGLSGSSEDGSFDMLLKVTTD